MLNEDFDDDNDDDDDEEDEKEGDNGGKVVTFVEALRKWFA